MRRTLLTGVTVVRADRVEARRTLVFEDATLVDIVAGARGGAPNETTISLDGRIVVPGFVDAHVHGTEGTDVLDGDGAVERVAARLPRWGVTAFSPTSVACRTDTLAVFLRAVGLARETRPAGSARVLPAHLESNFINPAFRGAQPMECLCAAQGDDVGPVRAADVLAVVARERPNVGIITMAPEMPGGIDLVRRLVGDGIRVSLGHSGATFEEARAAIHAGASRATHLFNAMPPLSHRDPGLVGAVLVHEHVNVELIADGVHVHPAVMRTVMAAKRPDGVLAVTDGTAASGLPRGSRTRLGHQSVTAADVARLDDGTMAGSVLTMDRAFAMLVRDCHRDLVDAARMCATSPARDLGAAGLGVIEPGAAADVTVLNQDLTVAETWVAGRRAWPVASATGS
jgi:N-acetylglucosamine-6-phosphate deacetylase